MRRTRAVPGEAERLVETYADLILRLSYTYLRSTADAEDLCQEVLLKLLRHGDGFASAEHERAWVIRVTANACKDQLRRARAHELVSLDELGEPEAPEPVDEEAAAMRADGVLAAVQGLGVTYREAIYLYYYEGYSTRQIAEACGCTESAAAQRVSRGRVQLRRILKGDGHGYDGRDISRGA